MIRFGSHNALLDEYHDISDEDIVSSAKNGNEVATEYLINKYKNFVRVKAKSYFLVGADREDIIQEGMIGLYKAIRDFKSDKLSSFRAFAELCITRQIITAIKTATRQKHIPLNSYISLNKPIYDEESDRTMMDIISSSSIADPEEVFISHELSDDIKESQQKLAAYKDSLTAATPAMAILYQENINRLEQEINTKESQLKIYQDNPYFQEALKARNSHQMMRYVASIREPELRKYTYSIVRTNEKGFFAETPPDVNKEGEFNYYTPISNWFDWTKLVTLIAVFLFGIDVVIFINLAKRGKNSLSSSFSWFARN